MLDRVFGSATEADDSNGSEQVSGKGAVKGILSEHENWTDIKEALSDNDVDSFVIRVNVNTLEKLSDLNCYRNDSHAYQDALKFAKRWNTMVDCYLTVIDTEEKFQVRISNIIATDITNSMIRDFATDFRTDIHSTFDPLAENHEEPYLSIEPF